MTQNPSQHKQFFFASSQFHHPPNLSQLRVTVESAISLSDEREWLVRKMHEYSTQLSILGKNSVKQLNLINLHRKLLAFFFAKNSLVNIKSIKEQTSDSYRVYNRRVHLDVA